MADEQKEIDRAVQLARLEDAVKSLQDQVKAQAEDIKVLNQMAQENKANIRVNKVQSTGFGLVGGAISNAIGLLVKLFG